MIGRVTHQTIQRNTLANLQVNLTKMGALQAQMSLGVKIGKASDNPADAASLLSMRATQRALTMQGRNIADAEGWLSTADSAIQGAISVLQRVRDLTVQGNNGSLGQTAKNAIVVELTGAPEDGSVGGLWASMLGIANTSYVGRSVFAGTSNTAAFNPDGTYANTATGTVQREVADGVAVRVDVNGAAVFTNGGVGDSVFTTIANIANALATGGTPDPADLDAIDRHLANMATQVAAVGARHNQVLSAKADLALANVNIRERISIVEDVDLAEILVELQLQEVAYQGALGAAAKTLQPTLLDYIR
jgi:flagellar hook-associated protein 3 FlgL